MRIQKIYNKLLAEYRLTSLIISGIVFLIYLFFITKLEYLYFDIITLYYLTGQSILLGYEYALINYFFSNVYQIFGKLNPLFQSGQYQLFSQNLEKKLRKSSLYYLIIAIVLTVFIILKLIRLLNDKSFNGLPDFFLTFYLGERTLWALLFDIFRQIVMYSTLFLMAVIIWIMIELVLTISELREKYSTSIDVFDTDETERGLKSMRSFILSIVSNYFIIVTLAIITSIPIDLITRFLLLINQILPNGILEEPVVPPGEEITDLLNIIFFSLMLPIGVILFMKTQQTIRNLIEQYVKSELKKINRKYKETYDKTIEISSNKKNTDNEKELKELKLTLEILEIETRKIKELNPKRADIKTTITFIISILIPILTIIEKMKGLL